VTSAFPLHRYTYQDYVWLEEESSTRHEFLDGEIVAMAGGTPEHAAMAAEVIGQLREKLRGGPCRLFTSGLGLRVMATGLATYPDASARFIAPRPPAAPPGGFRSRQSSRKRSRRNWVSSRAKSVNGARRATVRAERDDHVRQQRQYASRLHNVSDIAKLAICVASR
jgi:hypothetical protein